MASAWSEIKQIYQKTNKKQDFLFNQWVCRPPAAALVYLLKDRKITPNQVTFLSLLTALLGSATFLFWHSHLGLVVGALLLLLAFILDCTDGQLARIRGTSSQVGGLLDFLMDEIKAITLVAAIAGHLALKQVEAGNQTPALWWLGLGLLGVVIVSSGISLTTFMRRPEYVALSANPAGLDSSNPAPSSKTLLQKIIWGCEAVGHFIINYPSWLWLPAFLGKIEFFLIPYLVAHFLYLGRAGLSILWKLGR